jgi:homoserine kinase
MVRVRVPASSANLGPGFDAFAAALSLWLDLDVEQTGRFAVETSLEVARNRSNLVVRAFERLHPADGLRFRVRSQIPLSGGLGSSAAATLAGLAAAAQMFELDCDLLALASDIEGHPDNVAAALHGGFVICADAEVARIAPPEDLAAVAVVPGQPVATAAARAALPASVPLADAVFNVAHGALLTLGLARGDHALIARGLRDRLHQDARAPLFPRSHALLERAPALGATISGAGPTVLVWCAREQSEQVAAALRADVADWAQVVPLAFEPAGLSVSVH